MERSVYERDGPFVTERTERVGALINVTSEVAPGRGRVLVNTTPLMGEVFQDAAITAAYVAQERTGRNLSRSDVIVSIVADDQVPAVDGGSAGALMTLLTIAALQGWQPRSDMTLTGTIDQDGNVGAIGGVVEKATAAKEKGKTLFLLPRENSQLVRYTERTIDYYGYSVVRQVPERVDAKQYLESELGIRVEYVDTIDDVLRLAQVTPVALSVIAGHVHGTGAMRSSPSGAVRGSGISKTIIIYANDANCSAAMRGR